MTKRRMVVLAAAGAVGLGAVAVAVPAVAGVGPFGTANAATASPGPGNGSGNGNRNGMGTGMDYRPGMAERGMNADGAGPAQAGCLLGELAAKGTLTAEQQSTLAAMAQEEKLAHDLYVAFGDRYDAAVIFNRIAGSETQHLTIVRALLDRYGLADPTVGVAAGRFTDPAVQATYDRLLAEGQADLAAALRVGQTVEQADIDDLRAAQNGLTAPDVTQVYANLLEASQRHLTAFQRWS